MLENGLSRWTIVYVGSTEDLYGYERMLEMNAPRGGDPEQHLVIRVFKQTEQKNAKQDLKISNQRKNNCPETDERDQIWKNSIDRIEMRMHREYTV
jgi:primosomal protein N''